jgi:hypothetical protein
MAHAGPVVVTYHQSLQIALAILDTERTAHQQTRDELAEARAEVERLREPKRGGDDD